MKKINVTLLLFFIAIVAFAQKPETQFSITERINAYSATFPKENLYLSFDKPYYSVGDTLWYKSILLNANYGLNSLSDRLYVELFNDSNQLIERRVTPLKNGLGYGDFTFHTSLKDGSYTIRAYTNWQQNFGADYFFQKSFYLGAITTKTWLLTASEKIIRDGEKLNFEIKAKIAGINNEIIGYKDLELTLFNNNKRILQTNLQTSIEGAFEFNIPLSADKIDGNYSISIADKKNKTTNAILPITLATVNEIDLQFMPEGGYLVNDLFSKVAFKAIGKDGLGKEISGKIINSKQEEVTQFKSIHSGMGSFGFLPKEEENYYAVYELGDKKSQIKLPLVKAQGTTLRVDHLTKPDTILIAVRASETKRSPNDYQLIAQAGDSLILAVKLNLKNGFVNLKLPKQLFPDGIIHFTLFDPENIPVNERNAFINYHKKLNLKIETNKSTFTTNDSLALEIIATDESGNPLTGSFSIAVTDNNQVIQSENNGNIISHYLLQNKLRGNIEDAGWYFDNQDQHKLTALDNLVLTQAWIGYKWDELLKEKLPKVTFKQEKGNTITGKLTNMFNQPVPDVNITLMSLGKSLLITDTTSNLAGTFLFKDLPIVDTVSYKLKIRNTKGKTSNALIKVDEFIPAKAAINSTIVKPWYFNSDSISLKYFKNIQKSIKKQEKSQVILTGTALKEVEIIGNKKAQSFRQNSGWDASFLKKIDEAELKKMPEKSLFQLLKEKIPSFTVGNIWADGCSSGATNHRFTNFTIGSSLISHVIIDKINTHLVSCGIDDNYNNSLTGISQTATESEVYFTNRTIFDTFKASDIKDITIYKGCAYYFLEITTRSGNGPWTALPNGTYVHRPLPINFGREFYQPKYNVSAPATSNLNATIFWDANVVTDEKGSAKISFYSASSEGSYSVKVEGTDMLGRFGFKKSTIKISNQNQSGSK